MPCLSWAQDHTTAQTVQLSAITALDDIVVTTTRTEERLSQTGQAVTVIGRDELRQRQESDVLEELRDIPGFAVVQQGSRGSTASVFVRGGESDHNLVLIDGMKANVPGGTFDFGDVSLLGVERIEVVRGPHSALYGSDAMSSVVQLFTPRGHGTPQGFLRFRGVITTPWKNRPDSLAGQIGTAIIWRSNVLIPTAPSRSIATTAIPRWPRGLISTRSTMCRSCCQSAIMTVGIIFRLAVQATDLSDGMARWMPTNIATGVECSLGRGFAIARQNGGGTHCNWAICASGALFVTHSMQIRILARLSATPASGA